MKTRESKDELKPSYQLIRSGVVDLPFLGENDEVYSILGNESKKIILSTNKLDRCIQKITIWDIRNSTPIEKEFDVRKQEIPLLASVDFLPLENLLIARTQHIGPILLRADTLEMVYHAYGNSEFVVVNNGSKVAIVQKSCAGASLILSAVSPEGFIKKHLIPPESIWDDAAHGNAALTMICSLPELDNRVAVYLESIETAVIGICRIDFETDNIIVEKCIQAPIPTDFPPFIDYEQSGGLRHGIFPLPDGRLAHYSRLGLQEIENLSEESKKNGVSGKCRIFELQENSGEWVVPEPDVLTTPRLGYGLDTSFYLTCPFPYMIKHRVIDYHNPHHLFNCLTGEHPGVTVGPSSSTGLKSVYSQFEFIFHIPDSLHRYQFYQVVETNRYEQELRMRERQLKELLNNGGCPSLVDPLNAIVASYAVGTMGMFGWKKLEEQKRITIMSELDPKYVTTCRV